MLGLTMGNKIGELEIIERIRSGWGATQSKGAARAEPARDKQGSHDRGAGSGGVVLGIGDDCAILRPPRGHEVLVTTDFTLEGRHFRRDWHPPESVGHRALARGLSDLAAMGAQPLAAFLSLALPAEMLVTRAGTLWVERFFIGLRTLAGRCNVPLAGGDTSESPCGLVLADIMLVGSAPAGRALRRSRAKAGDSLYVTGELGGAAAELAVLARRGAKKHPAPHNESKESGAPGSTASPNMHPQLWPEPRLGVGQALLRRRLATAAIDLSDGLSTDLTHLCRESGVGAEIEAAALPIHPLATAHGTPEEAMKLALNGGEDYELLFAAPSAVRLPRGLAGVRLTRIGRLVSGTAASPGRISLINREGRRRALKPGGWEHFAGKH
jgi:thiamine-monophosphate kinase